MRSTLVGDDEMTDALPDVGPKSGSDMIDMVFRKERVDE
jgi:hypothetical protein